jgi:hypothetical protein
MDAGAALYDQNTLIPRHIPYPKRGIPPSLRHKVMFHMNITHYISLHTRPLMHRHI